MKPRPLALATLSLFILLSGCGGGGGGGGEENTPETPAIGRAVLTVQWPARNRGIPLVANAIVATLSLDGGSSVTQVVARPSSEASTSTTEFTDLRLGTYRVALKATPNADATGEVLAVGSGTVTVARDVPGQVPVVLASTAVRLAIPAVVVDKGKTATLTASATDATGNIVLISAGATAEPMDWSVDATDRATVEGSGPTAVVAGVRSGATVVRASFVVNDAGDRLTTSAPVTIHPIDDGTGTVEVQ